MLVYVLTHFCEFVSVDFDFYSDIRIFSADLRRQKFGSGFG